MRKLVLGIALVVCLDVAFIWMMANQPDPPEIASSVVPQAAIPVVHDPNPVTSVIEEYDINSLDRELINRAQSSSSVSVERVRRTRRSTNFKSSPDRATEAIQPRDPSFNAKHLFPDTIIVIGQTDSMADAARNRDRRPESPGEKPIAVAEAARPPEPSDEKNRSFESRAFSVIKKPYLWMRALASQIR